MPVVLRPTMMRGGFDAGTTVCIAGTGSQGLSSGAVGHQRLPGEALYSVNLTLQNVISGSLILITDLSNVEIARATAVGGNTIISVPFYGASQTVKVKVRKSTSSPFYQSYETQAVITSTGVSLYVSQISDET